MRIQRKFKLFIISAVGVGVLLAWAAPLLSRAQGLTPAALTPMVYLPVVMRQSTPTPTNTSTPTITPTPTHTPTPTPTATPFPSGYVLNGSFEIASNNTGSGNANWSPWWREIPKPPSGYDYAYQPNSKNQECLSTGAASVFIFTGNCSQRVMNNWDPWWGGVTQLVTVPANQNVRLTAYGRVWASGDAFPAPSNIDIHVKMQVGIEPNGNCTLSPSSDPPGSIVWSPIGEPHNVWQAFTVTTKAGAGGQVCVILSADYRGFSQLNLLSVWDAVSLVNAP